MSELVTQAVFPARGLPFPCDKPLIVKGAGSQSANLFEIQNSSGTFLVTLKRLAPLHA